MKTIFNKKPVVFKIKLFLCLICTIMFKAQNFSQACDIIIGCNELIYGSTVGSPNNLNNVDYQSCPNFNSSSPFSAGDYVVRFEVPIEGATITLTTLFSGIDLDLFIFKDECPLYDDPTRLTIFCYNKSTSSSGYESIKITEPGTYFAVVDGYIPSHEGDFNLELQCSIDCTDLPELECNVPYFDWTGCGPYPPIGFWSCVDFFDINCSSKISNMQMGYSDIYKFTAPVSGSYKFKLSEMYADADLFISDNICGGTPDEIFCIGKSENNGNADEEVVLNLTKNESIEILIDGEFTTYNIVVECPSVCDFCCQIPSTYNRCFGFEEYNNGNLTPQANPDFTDFPASPTPTKATVVSSRALGGTKSIYFNDRDDIDYNINRTISKPSRLEWSMYVENGKAGSWGLETNNPSIYPIFMNFYDGTAVLLRETGSSTSETIKAFPYIQNKWLKFALIFNPETSTIELFIDDEFIHASNEFLGVKKINQINFYHYDNDNNPNTAPNFPTGFYVDNICYQEIDQNAPCTHNIDYVCVNGKTFDNYCYANRAGYCSEISDGVCTDNCNFCCDKASSYQKCIGFEVYNSGDLTPQANPDFTEFPASPSPTKATVVTNRALGGTKSIYFNDRDDIDFNINRTITTPTRLEWSMHFESGKAGSWGLETSSSTIYPLLMSFYNGVAKLYRETGASTSQEIKTVSYAQNKWIKFVLIFTPTDNKIELFIDGQLVHTSFEFAGAKKVNQLNFYKYDNDNNPNTNPTYSTGFNVDNICYSEMVPLYILCTEEWDPVCMNGQTYSNACHAIAYLALTPYTACEYEIEEGECDDPNRLTFDLEDNVCGKVGQTIDVPIRVKNFTNIEAFAFSINISSATDVMIESVTKGNVAGNLSYELFANNIAAVTWFADNPITLPDNSVVLNIKVKILKAFNNAPTIQIVNAPSEIIAANNIGEVPVSVIDGSLCYLSGIDICGKITKEDNKPIKNVLVKLTAGGTVAKTTRTDANGNYCFNGVNAINYSITASKDTLYKNGVNILDVNALNKHNLGKTLLSSPYKIIAGDVTKDYKTNILDVNDINKLTLNKITDFSKCESWVFIPKSYTFSDPKKPLSPVFPEKIDVVSATSTADFIGVKMGDTDNSSNGQNFVEFKVENRSVDNIILSANNITTNQNSEFSITFKVNNFEDIEAFAFSLKWDANYFEFLSLVPNQSLNSIEFNEDIPGKLGLSWFGTPVSIVDDGTFFTITFKSLNNSGTKQVQIDNAEDNLAINENGDVLAIEFNDSSVTVPTSDILKKQITVYPNPIQDKLYLSAEEIENIRIIDLTGKLLLHFNKKHTNGFLDVSQLHAGMYYISFECDNITYQRKFVKI